MYTKLLLKTAPSKRENNKTLNQPKNLSYGLNKIIEIRELDKRLTHANPKRGKCTMEGCDNCATHWLTRSNVDYCQSDMVCNKDAIIWMQVKDLIDRQSGW
ncbi:hypothetical protein C7B62_21475 [Pleurocapsa sp. CCALA 161]|uniref:hypothetical protein n=1 Tax=Pleurocapsa sp. CCALA 161 TaxID=2107688 RepID=UPI000D07137E|nr:hypothetical protein [Pleurocapsa sp. CCALA 161]PSB06926.1 hypothetical protein C7B62_21475 [Pleurocapsa sp. CCALA 161]